MEKVKTANPLTESGKFKSDWAMAIANQLKTAADMSGQANAQTSNHQTNWFDLAAQKSSQWAEKRRPTTQAETANQNLVWG